MRRIRYGMIGGGSGSFVGAIHRTAARVDDGWSFVCGAMSSTPERSRQSGTEAGLPEDRCYASWQEMLEHEAARDAEDRMEAVVIVTPNHLHADPAIAALEAGFHVVCDKPMCTTLEDADRIVTAAARASQQNGTVFAVTYNYSGYPLVKHARHLIDSGAIGPVRKVVVEYHQGWLSTKLEETGQKQASWRVDPSKSGAGALGDIGSHAEQLARYITGLELTELCADVTSFVEGRPVDDDASVLMRFGERDGVRAKGVLMASQIAGGKLNDLRIRVFGETGSLDWSQENPNTLAITELSGPTRVLHRGDDALCDEARAASRLPPGHPEGFYEAFANIYRGARGSILGNTDHDHAGHEQRECGGAIDHPTAHDGALGVRFIHACLDSARDGSVWKTL